MSKTIDFLHNLLFLTAIFTGPFSMHFLLTALIYHPSHLMASHPKLPLFFCYMSFLLGEYARVHVRILQHYLTAFFFYHYSQPTLFLLHIHFVHGVYFLYHLTNVATFFLFSNHLILPFLKPFSIQLLLQHAPRRVISSTLVRGSFFFLPANFFAPNDLLFSSSAPLMTLLFFSLMTHGFLRSHFTLYFFKLISCTPLPFGRGSFGVCSLA